VTKVQNERRAAEEAAALEEHWLAHVKSEQQPAETKEQPSGSGSFRKSADVRHRADKLSRLQALTGRRKANRSTLQ
jgi:hypothetical protein